MAHPETPQKTQIPGARAARDSVLLAVANAPMGPCSRQPDYQIVEPILGRRSADVKIADTPSRS